MPLGQLRVRQRHLQLVVSDLKDLRIALALNHSKNSFSDNFFFIVSVVSIVAIRFSHRLSSGPSPWLHVGGAALTLSA